MTKQANVSATFNYSDASIDDLALHAIVGKVQYECSVNELKSRLKGKDRDHVREVLLPFYSMVYGVNVIDGKLDKNATDYERCRKALQRTTNEIVEKAPTATPRKNLRIAKEVRASAIEFLSQFDSVSQAIAVLKQVA